MEYFIQAQGNVILGKPAFRMQRGGSSKKQAFDIAFGEGQETLFATSGGMDLDFQLEKHIEGSTLVCNCNIGDPKWMW